MHLSCVNLKCGIVAIHLMMFLLHKIAQFLGKTPNHVGFGCNHVENVGGIDLHAAHRLSRNECEREERK